MPPVIVSLDLDVTSSLSDSDQIDIDFLLPNGICIPLQVEVDKPLDLVKQVSEDKPLVLVKQVSEDKPLDMIIKTGE